MSDSLNIDEVLSGQRAARQRREEQERQEEEAAQRHRELVEAFHHVRYCTNDSLPSGTDFFEEFSRRVIELVRLLSQRGELDGLLDCIKDISEISSVNERDARAFVVHLLGVAVQGDQQEVARRVREAVQLPFRGHVNEWLRRDLESTFLGRYPLTDSVDGVCWPLLMPNEPDPLETLRQACDCVVRAFEQRNLGEFGSPNPRNVVNGLWRLVHTVAKRLRRTPPALPDQILDAEAVRQVVLVVRDWCDQVAANADDPREEMRYAIRHERLILGLFRNASSNGVDCQGGINRLWERWRDLFPLVPPPARPTACRNYHEASDAVDALVRALNDLSASATTESGVVPISEFEDLSPYKVEDQSWYLPLPETKELRSEELVSLADKIDIILLTATDPELEAVLRRLDPFPKKKAVLKGFVEQETYYLGKFGACQAAVTKCRMGSLDSGAATLATQHAQSVWRPRALVMVGIALGKDPTKQMIADVLVASQVISYEPQRVGENQVIPRGPITPANTTLLNRFENVPQWSFNRPDGSRCRCYVGPILSGEKMVDSPAFKASLTDRYPQAIGGEMEGVGLAAAAVRHGVAWILVKAICDWGDGHKHNKHQPLAAAAAASLVHQVLSQKDVLHGLKKPNGA
jgi:nucleoside phosphorylase